MGQFSAKLCKFLPFKPDESRILVTGVKGAGKTTLLGNLRLGVIEPHQNIELGMQTIKYKNMKFTSLDLDAFPLNSIPYENLYKGYEGIIFIVDSQDKKKMKYVLPYFKKLLAEKDLENIPILIFANKQDIDAKVMSLQEISKIFELPNIINRQYYINGLCAFTNEGLNDALFWLSHVINCRKYQLKM